MDKLIEVLEMFRMLENRYQIIMEQDQKISNLVSENEKMKSELSALRDENRRLREIEEKYVALRRIIPEKPVYFYETMQCPKCRQDSDGAYWCKSCKDWWKVPENAEFERLRKISEKYFMLLNGIRKMTDRMSPD